VADAAGDKAFDDGPCTDPTRLEGVELHIGRRLDEED
jgi:hypothetical protein